MAKLFNRQHQAQVKAPIRSIAALKTYIKEPKCLRCGYDLRGQFMSGLASCSECGQACDAEAIAAQVSSQRAGHLPVLTEVRAGVMVALLVPIACLLLGGVVNALLFNIGIRQVGDLAWAVYFWLSCLVWVGLLIYTAVISYRVFQSLYGPLLWCLSLIYSFVFFSTFITAATWVFALFTLVVLIFTEQNYNRDMMTLFKSPWLHVGAAAAVLIFVLNHVLSNRWIVKPCRERCRLLALELVRSSIKEINSSDSAPAGEGGDAPER